MALYKPDGNPDIASKYEVFFNGRPMFAVNTTHTQYVKELIFC